MSVLIKAGRTVCISLHFPGNVASHLSAGSCSQLQFAILVAPSCREYQAAFPGQTADLGALLATPVIRQGTNKFEHWGCV